MQDSRKIDRELLTEIKRMHHQMPRWVVLIILIGVFAVLAYYTAGLLVILLMSGVLAYMLIAVINKVESYGIKRNVAVVTLYLSMAVFFIVAEIILAPCLQDEVKNFYTKLPEFSKQVENVFSLGSSSDMQNYPLAEELIRKILNNAISPGQLLEKTLNFSELFSQAASFLLAMILIPFFVFFLLKDWPGMLKTVMGWIPPVYVETTVSALSEINILVGKYLRGLIIDCISIGIIATVGLWWLGINYPLSLGILSGAANVIPYLGPIMACSAACLIAFIQFNSIGVLINVLLLYTVIKLTDDLIIQPLTIGKSVRLHPMLLVLTIIAGEKLFGAMGMILAVPVVTIAQKVLSILFESHRQNAAGKIIRGVKEKGCPSNIPL